MKVAFDTGPDGHPQTFTDPLRVIRADTPGEVDAALAALSREQAAGHWLAGCFSYELGYCLDQRLAPLLPAEREMPLIQMGVFANCEASAPPATANHATLHNAGPSMGPNEYAAAFRKVHAYIEAGDVYQVNLTFPLAMRSDTHPEALFHALAAVQPVRYGAFVDLGGPVLLSRSPEVFFEVDAHGWIETRPMKGTAARHPDPAADTAAREALAASAKNRAENLMIVDLMRNDLSRISEIGSVTVPALFDIETYATVHQMTSTIRARLRAGIGLPEILRALFPCGSITGAPKIRAMEIIRELETSPRGAYCGAIGWVAPGGAMRFNVAIRTLIWHGPDRIVLNVGGGLVHDSTPAAEYDEALCKSRFATLDPRNGA